MDAEVEKRYLTIMSRLVALHEQSQSLKESDFITYGLGLIRDLTQSQLASAYFLDDAFSGGFEHRFNADTLFDAVVCYQDLHALVLNPRLPIVRHGIINNSVYPSDNTSVLRYSTVPVLYNGQVVARFVVANKAGDYEPKDIALLKMFATQIWRVTYQNVTTLKLTSQIEQSNAQKEALRLAAAAFSKANEGIMITDKRGIIQQVNDAVPRITGYQSDELIGKTPAVFSSQHHDHDFYLQMWQSLLQQGCWQGEIWNRRKTGELYPEWLSISRLLDDNEQTTHYIGVFSDITERKAREDRIRYLASHDILTGLPNRSVLEESYCRLSALSAGNQLSLAVLFLDLDRFKSINDSLGHHIGDQLLVQVALRIQSILGEGDFVCRFGGDEFVLLLPNIETMHRVESLAAALLAILASPFFIFEHTVATSFSVGVSVYPRDGKELDVLLKQADAAMYQAKALGRNRYCFYNDC